MKENLKKFSDSVKSTFRHFKDTTKNIFDEKGNKRFGSTKEAAAENQEQFLMTIYIHSTRHLHRIRIVEALLCEEMEGKKSQFTLKTLEKIQIHRNAVPVITVGKIILSERLVLVCLNVLKKNPLTLST